MEKQSSSVKEYIRIMRLDHATKHIFVLPGVVSAAFLVGFSKSTILSFICGFIAVLCIASANYTINEFLDREFDKFHPEKSQRAAVQTDFSASLIWMQWFCLVFVGISSAALIGPSMLIASILFALQGIIYNVRPFRSKERAFLDVVSESINNPLRLTIGWAMVSPDTVPPILFLIAYWLGGSFLMAAKRLSEYREITSTLGKDVLVSYRKSFIFYTESSLMGSCLVYALLSSTLINLFLVSWRQEYILTIPLICALFVIYYLLSCLPNSVAQKPERLFQEPSLMIVCVLLAIDFAVTSYFHIPYVQDFLSISPLHICY